MRHRFYEGEIIHKRFLPKTHTFSYDFFFLDICIDTLETLKAKHFSQKAFAPMAFFARDHFGQSHHLADNAFSVIDSLGWVRPAQLRFITLPRIFGFVFNPISLLLLLNKDEKPTQMVVEVHNYNGGRVLYPMQLETEKNGYIGVHPKSMYVSPFLGYEGLYRFKLRYSPDNMTLLIELEQEASKMLMAHFEGKARPFSAQSIRSLLCSHTFLSFFVVTRTLWQSLKLFLKGIAWKAPRPIDQTQKDLAC